MTTTKTLSEQADEIVEMFTLQLFMYPGMTDKKVVNIAILHVTGIIEVLEKVMKDSLLPSTALIKELDDYQQILTILKSRC